MCDETGAARLEAYIGEEKSSSARVGGEERAGRGGGGGGGKEGGRGERSAWGTACSAFRMATEFSVPSQGRRGTAPLNQLCHFYAPRLIFAVFYHSSVINLFPSRSSALPPCHSASNTRVEINDLRMIV